MKPFQFLKEVFQQTKQISWPNKKTVLKLSSTIILISFLSSLVLGSFDLLFASAFAKISQSKQSPDQLQAPLDQQFDLESIATNSAQPPPSTPLPETSN